MIDWILKGVCHDDVISLNSMQAAARNYIYVCHIKVYFICG